MKNKILSFFLVIAMLVSTTLSVFAEDTADKGLDTTPEINIEKNADINDLDDGSYSEEDLDGNKEEIFEPTPSQEEPEQTEEEAEVDSQEPEGTPSEGSTEPSNNEGTPEEETPVETEPTESEPIGEDTEGIVEEVIEGQPFEEQPANIIPKEPQIFFITEGLTLTREADALTLQGYYPCENNTGVDVKLVAIQVIPLNDWVLVGSEVDFKNSKEGLKEYRLTVNGQLIDSTFENGVALIEDQVELLNGFSINIPIKIEMGPFKESLNDEVLSLVLVFEEIVEEEIVEIVEIVEVVEVVEGVTPEESTNIGLDSSPAEEQEIVNDSENGVIPEDEALPEDEEQTEETSSEPNPPDTPTIEEVNQGDPPVEDNPDEGVEVDIIQEGVKEVDPSPDE